MRDSKDDPEVTALTETQEDKRHRISLTCAISKHKKTCMDTEQTQDTENKQVVVKQEKGLSLGNLATCVILEMVYLHHL
ncbi:unnamed protein product [Rangifer tarandus platyrhynchus]|uniref:Uncharacterized protein n=1 Tax=Rangifer tarandus platyrhynchus TaxID=3082113 RepID=A0AC59ZP35_RANTA